MKKTVRIPLTIIGALAVAIGMSFAQTAPALAGEEVSSIARGGKLYDKWFKVTGAKAPKETHAAWPSSNTKKKGNVTHRCKSCHGWDGKGKDGAYASGSYKTGIKGVNALWGAPAAKIVAVMKDKTHGFGGKMEDRDFNDLAMFVSKGMPDMAKYIDSKTKMPKNADKDKGAAYYITVCAGCHREDGSRPKDMEGPLGSFVGNPWEVMHKILNGQPGEPMPGLRAFAGAEQIAMDILAHLRTLPKKR